MRKKSKPFKMNEKPRKYNIDIAENAIKDLLCEVVLSEIDEDEDVGEGLYVIKDSTSTSSRYGMLIINWCNCPSCITDIESLDKEHVKQEMIRNCIVWFANKNDCIMHLKSSCDYMYSEDFVSKALKVLNN